MHRSADEKRARYREKAILDQTIRADRRAVLIVNTRSRRAQWLYAEAKELLIEHGVLLDATYPVRDPARLPEIVQQAIEQGPRFIIVGGGDGTISSVVDFFVHRNIVLGILPLGTANSFARTIGLPLSLTGAVDVLANGKVADIDLGKVNDDYFANAAAIGLPAAIGRSMPHGLKKWLGRVGYLLVGGLRLMRLQPFRCTITHEGGTFESDALEVRIANGGYHGGILVAQEASVESRDLVIHIVPGRSRWSLARAWVQIGGGIRPPPAALEVLRVREAVINTAPQHYVSIDGEVVTQTPVRVSVESEALRLMVPQGFADREDVA